MREWEEENSNEMERRLLYLTKTVGLKLLLFIGLEIINLEEFRQLSYRSKRFYYNRFIERIDVFLNILIGNLEIVTFYTFQLETLSKKISRVRLKN